MCLLSCELLSALKGIAVKPVGVRSPESPGPGDGAEHRPGHSNLVLIISVSPSWTFEIKV